MTNTAHHDLKPENTACDAFGRTADESTKAPKPTRRTTTATRLGDDARESSHRKSDEG
jgi:hypothetical protein